MKSEVLSKEDDSKLVTVGMLRFVLDERFDAFEAKLGKRLDKRFDDFEARMEKRFEKQLEKQLDERFDAFESKINKTIEKTFDRKISEFAEMVANGFREVHTRTDGLEERVVVLESKTA